MPSGASTSWKTRKWSGSESAITPSQSKRTARGGRAGIATLRSDRAARPQPGDRRGVVPELAEDRVGVLAEGVRRQAHHRRSIGELERRAERADAAVLRVLLLEDHVARDQLRVRERLADVVHRAEADVDRRELPHPLVARLAQKCLAKERVHVLALLALGVLQGNEIGTAQMRAQVLPEVGLERAD